MKQLKKVRTGRTDPVKRAMDEELRPITHKLKTKKRPKHVRPVHEIDPDDPYLGEEDIYK